MANGEWSRDEFLITLDLYLNEDITEDTSDPKVQETAELIGRTPDAVVYRLGNYRHLDPVGTKGLKNTGRPCVEIWQEFYGNESELRRAAEDARRWLADAKSDSTVPTNGDTEIGDNVRQTDDVGEGSGQDRPISTDEGAVERPTRRGQQDFRMAVRERYDDTCLLCDVSDPGLLQAGHILSWSDHDAPRGDPSNGILLCYTHHRAFDLGLFTITSEYELRVHQGYNPGSKFLHETVIALDGTELPFPHDPPGAEHLRGHNEHEVHWYDVD
jgi:hypothetical protein